MTKFRNILFVCLLIVSLTGCGSEGSLFGTEIVECSSDYNCMSRFDCLEDKNFIYEPDKEIKQCDKVEEGFRCGSCIPKPTCLYDCITNPEEFCKEACYEEASKELCDENNEHFGYIMEGKCEEGVCLRECTYYLPGKNSRMQTSDPFSIQGENIDCNQFGVDYKCVLQNSCNQLTYPEINGIKHMIHCSESDFDMICAKCSHIILA